MKRFTASLGALLGIVLFSSGYADGFLRQSTSRVMRICGVVAVGDGFTPVTTLALSTADEAEALRDNTATLDISGATWAAITGADGCYSLTLDTTATNTVGELVVAINDDSLVLPIWRTFTVLEEAVYDITYAAAAIGAVPVQDGTGTGQIDTNAGAVVAVTTAANLTNAPTAGDFTATMKASINTEADTALTDYDGPTNTELNARTLVSANYFDPAADSVLIAAGEAAEIQAAADAALVARRLDELLNADSDVDGAAPPTVGSVFHEMMTKTPGSFTYDQTTDSPEAIRDRGDAAWITATGFSTFDPAATGVFLSTSVNNCRAAIGCEAQGTLTGTHSSTTADLGTNAPAATTEVVGKTLVVTGKTSRVVTAYNPTTGVSTFAPATALTLANDDQWYLWGTSPSANSTQDTYESLPLVCTIDTATFAGSTTTVGCDLTDVYGAVVTSATGRLTGKELCVTSGAQMRECRFIGATTAWNGTTNELEITLTRPMPATLADTVTAIIK